MSFSPAELAANPRFVNALQLLGGQLQQQYDSNPRLARFFASHQRWLLSQAAFALQMEYDPASQSSGLTTNRLKDMITRYNAASRNTVLNFLDQLLTYRFMRLASGANKRPRRFEATEVSTDAMIGWVAVNLAALDLVDGSSRYGGFMERPELFRLMQPRIARNCLEDSRWREPPERVAMFLWTEGGGLVMDELVRRIDVTGAAGDRHDLGRIEARIMAEHFMMSRTHLQRLLRKAVEADCLAWHDDNKKTHMWMTQNYLREYSGWQSVKFSIVDEAYQWASAALGQSAGRSSRSIGG